MFLYVFKQILLYFYLINTCITLTCNYVFPHCGITTFTQVKHLQKRKKMKLTSGTERGPKILETMMVDVDEDPPMSTGTG